MTMRMTVLCVLICALKVQMICETIYGMIYDGQENVSGSEIASDVACVCGVGDDDDGDGHVCDGFVVVVSVVVVGCSQCHQQFPLVLVQTFLQSPQVKMVHQRYYENYEPPLGCDGTSLVVSHPDLTYPMPGDDAMKKMMTRKKKT